MAADAPPLRQTVITNATTPSSKMRSEMVDRAQLPLCWEGTAGRAGRQFYRPPASIPAAPQGRTCDALDLLAEPETGAASIKEALDRWRWYTRIPSGPRRWEKAPRRGRRRARSNESRRRCRDSRRAEARPLRRLVAALDERFLSTTVPDPSLPVVEGDPPETPDASPG